MADISSEELSLLFEKQRNGIQLTTEEMRKLGMGTKEFAVNLKALGMASQSAALGLSGFAKGMANGEASFKSLNPLIDGVTGALGELAKTLPFAGNMISGSLKLAGEGAKFLLEQLDTATKSFQEMSQVGALTSKGLTGLKQQFLTSRMTLQGFQRAVSENANVLARFKGTVGTGAEDFAKIVGTLADPNNQFARGLYNIGYRADELGDTVASFMNQQLMMSNQSKRSQEELIKGSHEYALEIDRLAKLTGESRKAVRNQLDAAMSEGRFLAGIRSLPKDVGDNLKSLQSRIAKTNPEAAQGLRDSLFGVTTEAAKALYRTTNGVSRQVIEDMKAKRINDDQAVERINNAIGVKLPQVIGRARTRGDEGPYLGTAGSVRSVTGEVAGSGKTARDSQNTTDQMTESVALAQLKLEDMSRNISELSFNLLTFAVPAVSAFTTVLNGAVRKISKELGIDLPELQQPDRGGLGKSVTSDTSSIRRGENLAKITSGEVASRSGIGTTSKRLAEYGVEYTGKALSFLGATTVGGYLQNKAQESDRIRTQEESLLTSIDDLVSFQNDSGGKAAFYDLADEVQIQFLRMADEYRKLTGEKLVVVSSKRSEETQKKLYDAYVARGYTGIPAAKPGFSRHEKGLAIDLPGGQVQDLLRSGMIKRFGFDHDPRDPVHIFQKGSAGDKGGFADGGISQGPKSGYMAMLHGLEAIVPLSNNRSIPVSFKDTGASQLNTASFDQNLPILNDAINRQSAVLQQQLEKSEAMIQALNRFASGDQMQVMIDKLQNINDKMSTGNDINAKLLQVSM
jgi:hypothetical protein